VSARYWKLRQIFRRKINIREDKLVLYHCLLELGLPKVNLSEHLFPWHFQLPRTKPRLTLSLPINCQRDSMATSTPGCPSVSVIDKDIEFSQYSG
jgi:hypothetical protein